MPASMLFRGTISVSIGTAAKRRVDDKLPGVRLRQGSTATRMLTQTSTLTTAPNSPESDRKQDR